MGNNHCFLFLLAEVSSEYSMDKAMVEFAMMDRELNHYVKAVQSAMNHVSVHAPLVTYGYKSLT